MLFSNLKLMRIEVLQYRIYYTVYSMLFRNQKPKIIEEGYRTCHICTCYFKGVFLTFTYRLYKHSHTPTPPTRFHQLTHAQCMFCNLEISLVRLTFAVFSCRRGAYYFMLRIHDILGWIRIRGSMSLTNGSGSGSCYFRHWPSRRHTIFSAYYFLKVHLHHKRVTK